MNVEYSAGPRVRTRACRDVTNRVTDSLTYIPIYVYGLIAMET